MSKRRKFLVLMASTASVGVLSSISKGFFSSSYAQNEDFCKIDLPVLPVIVPPALEVITKAGKATQALVSAVASANSETITFLSSKIDQANDAKFAFWSKSSNVARFVKSAAVSDQKKAAQALKGRFSDKQITEAVRKAIANLKKNNISAIESDPIIGSVVKAGYVGASKKLREAADRQKEVNALRKELRGRMAIRVETEAFNLKKASKITNKDLQGIAKLYPSLAPSLKKALELKSDATPIERFSLDTGDAVSGTSASNQNRFDAYAQTFESRLSAVTTPINGEGDLTLVDMLMGVEKANAIEPITILAIVAVTAVLVIVGTVAVAEAIKNDACKEAQLKLNQPAAVAACEERANNRRRQRLAAEERAYRQCLRDFSWASIVCAIGNALAKNDIESDYERDVNACS